MFVSAVRCHGNTLFSVLLFLSQLLIFVHESELFFFFFWGGNISLRCLVYLFYLLFCFFGFHKIDQE